MVQVPGVGAGGAPGLQITRGFSLGNILEFTDLLATDAPSSVWPGAPRERCGPARLADPDAYSCTLEGGSSSSSSISSSSSSSIGSSGTGAGTGGGAEIASQGSAGAGGMRCECWVPRAAVAAAAAATSAAGLTYESFFAVQRPLCQILPVARLQPARGIGARMRTVRRSGYSLEPPDLTPVLDSIIMRTASLAVRLGDCWSRLRTVGDL